MKPPPPRGNRQRREGNRPIACVKHTPAFEPDCIACRSLLVMILKMSGEAE